MVVPGPVGNLDITAGDSSLFVSFTAPITGGAGPFTYGYKLRINSSPFLPPAIPWSVAPTSSSVISIPVSSGINNGDTYSIVIIPSNIDGPGTELESATVTPSVTIVDMSYTEPVDATGSVAAEVTDATLQSGDETAILEWSFASSTFSTVTYDITPPDESNIVAGNVDRTTAGNGQIYDIAYATAAGVEGTVASISSISASKVSLSGDVEQTADISIDYSSTFTELPPDLEAATSVQLEVYRVQNAAATLVQSVKAQINMALKQLKAINIRVTPKSVYVFIYKTSSGTTITVPIENNQAYNDYLHDESGYQNRRENRLLTSGFYRGPVDSSTLTRIRAANGVLLGVNGVPGGMQGSRCCQ